MRIAVHLHLYYQDMWEEISGYLKNLEGYNYSLFITIVEENLELRKKIEQFNSKSTIWLVENRGYDVGPFIYFLNQINLDEFDLVLKIQSKRDLKNRKVQSYLPLYKNRFRNYLLNGVLKNKKEVSNIINLFKNNNKIGLVGSKYLTYTDKISYYHNILKITDLLDTIKNLGFNVSLDTPVSHISGTMFFIKASLLKIFVNNNYNINMFEPNIKGVKVNSFAHTIEIVFGAVVVLQGYVFSNIIDLSKTKQILYYLHRIYLFFYSIIFYGIFRFILDLGYSKKGYFRIKFFRITVYKKYLDK